MHVPRIQGNPLDVFRQRNLGDSGPGLPPGLRTKRLLPLWLYQVKPYKKRHPWPAELKKRDHSHFWGHRTRNPHNRLRNMEQQAWVGDRTRRGIAPSINEEQKMIENSIKEREDTRFLTHINIIMSYGCQIRCRTRLTGLDANVVAGEKWKLRIRGYIEYKWERRLNPSSSESHRLKFRDPAAAGSLTIELLTLCNREKIRCVK
jgi:hypothetical protein